MSLSTFEMNFSYMQDQVKKNALVKVRVCNECEVKLNYKKVHKKIDSLIDSPIIKKKKEKKYKKYKKKKRKKNDKK